MKWLKRGALAVAALLCVLLALPFVAPVDDYRPRIERALSERLKEPVAIERLRAHVLPAPHVTAEGVRIGKADDVKIAMLEITPDVWSLLQDVKVIRHVELSGVRLTLAGAQKLTGAAGAGSASNGGAAKTKGAPLLRVRRVTLSDTVVAVGKAVAGPFDASAVMRDDGALEQVTARLRDGKLNVSLKPEGGRYLLDAHAKGWRWPVGAPVLFDELTLKGVLTASDFTTSTLSSRLCGGTANGNLTLAWGAGGKGVRLNGAFDANQLDVAELAALAASKAGISGRLNARPAISATAGSFAGLVDVLRVETPFQVTNGVFRGVDIRKAATHLLTKDSSGETRFYQLSGHLVMAAGTKRFTNLKVASGALAADGNVTVTANRSLSGRVNVQLKAGVVTAASIPLNVGGTLDAPVLFPTAAAIAGAAAGAAVLGPAGASVGAKVGEWVEGIFGRGKGK